MTGAGDAFNGAFATFIVEGYSLNQAVNRANAVGALSVTKLGTAISKLYLGELESFLQNERV